MKTPGDLVDALSLPVSSSFHPALPFRDFLQEISQIWAHPAIHHSWLGWPLMVSSVHRAQSL